MNCKHAQQQMHDLADGRLTAPVADELRRHLSECTDCRVAEQRTAKLQRLIALKRHEQPPAGYFENFLNEFHQRLAEANAPRPTLWSRLVEHLTVEPGHVWRYGLAGAIGLCAAGIITWYTLPAPQPIAANDAPTPVASNTTSVVPVIAAAAPGLTYTEPAVFETSGSIIVSPNATDTPGEPRYVLDRLAVTPVSYEAANVHF
jgi:anti-sigma factor RsiW